MKSHYDVGMVGCWYWGNYGSLLNGYATQQLLKSLGLSVLNIVTPYNGFEPHAKKFFEVAYEEDEISPVLPFEQLYQYNEICDVFLTGSDQIWNYKPDKPTRTYDKYFRLDFADDNKKKISFATSFGKYVQETANDHEIFQKLFDRYDAISVREEEGVKILRDSYGINAIDVLEPVLAVDKDCWTKIAEYSQFNEEEPYILTYILDPTPEKREAIKSYSEKLGIKAINILDGFSANYDRNKNALNLPNTLPNIWCADFLKYYMNAKYVITDSFHGVCFSLIYNKPFMAIGNYGRGIKRFEHLLNKIGLGNRLICDFSLLAQSDILLRPIDFEPVNKIISSERERTVLWLKKVIETPKEQLPTIKIKALNSTNVLQDKLCSGCGCCANVCPVNAITMITNDEGFYVPNIDESRCINCGLCTERCVALKKNYVNVCEPKCYAVMADDLIRKISSSGGMFSISAEYVINNGGYVCGAIFDEDFKVKHVLTNNREVMAKMRGSKYIQSNPCNVYREIKSLLDKGTPVLFTGMPCQVAGLQAYLNKQYNELITIDIFCHGITSSKVFEKYLADVHSAKDLKEIYFKAKEPWGWHAGINAYFKDGSSYSEPLERDPYYISYLNSMSKNKSCGGCLFNKLPRQGDLSIGDFWGISRFDSKLNDNKGTSVVLVNNPKAQQFFDKLIDNMRVCAEVPLSVAIKGNLVVTSSYALHRNRNIFFDLLDQVHFANLTKGIKTDKIWNQYYINLLSKLPKNEREMYFLAKAAAEKSKGRKIVTWIRSQLFEKVLKEQFGMDVEFGVSKRRETVDNRNVRYIDALKGHKEEYYLVSLDAQYNDTDYNLLKDYGYNELDDFIFRIHKPLVLENFDCSKSMYMDNYGNTIEGINGKVGKIIIRGCNNHITFGKDVRGLEKCTIIVGSNAECSIGEGTFFREPIEFQLIEHNAYATLNIGKNCVFGTGLFRIIKYGHDTSVIINDNCTFENDLEIHANSGKRIVVGKDCMFSHNVNIWSGDGHAIFDVKTGKPINCNGDKYSNGKDCVIIGDHVWVAYGAFLLHGTNVGNGSIIGAQSVVKGVFANNCSTAGNPAKVIKTDVAWSRQGTATNMDVCGEENINLTSNAKAPISGMNVLVIGGTKFMGIKLVEELIKLGNNVVVANRGRKGDNFGTCVERLIMDVSDAKSVEKALKGKYFDVVFDNLAYCSNYVKNVLDVVECRRYIQLSSVEAYVPTKNDLKESDYNPYVISHKWCEPQIGYQEGKQQAEATVYQKYPNISAVTVRIPYVAPTDRLLYYCRRIVLEKYMRIDDVSRGFTFVRDSEVGKFLPWIAAQDYEGPINLASTGFVTIKMLLEYIEKKTGKVALVAPDKGDESPFHVYNEKNFSMSMRVAERLGYKPSKLDDWLWKQVDGYIEAALKELRKD